MVYQIFLPMVLRFARAGAPLLIKFFSISLKDVSMATNCVRLNLKKQTPEFPFLIKISAFCWFEQMLNLIVSIKIVIRLWSWYKLIQVGTSQTSLRASSVGKHLLPSPAPEHPRKLARSLKPIKLSWLGIYNLTSSTCCVILLLFSLVRHSLIKIWRAILNFSNGNG